MKKFVIGCLIVVVVLGIGGAIGAYYFVWRPAKAYVTELAKLKEIPQLNQQVKKKTAFAAPADNVLTGASVDRFLKTQQEMQTKLGARLDELSSKYRTLGGAKGDARPSISELTGAFRDLAGLIVEAKRVQVEALNQNDFSLAEYDWTRQRIYEAAGIPIDASFEKALQGMAEGKTVDASAISTTAVAVPEQNRTLVSSHTKELTERAVLAAFGL